MKRQVYVDAKIRYACAIELDLPNEQLVFTNYDAIGGYVDFCHGDVFFAAKLTKNGRGIKKGSVRRDFS